MFAVRPRRSDDCMMSLADELFSPWQFRLPVRPGDFILEAGRESEVQNTDREFRIRLDLKHYSPEEVKITSDSHRVMIHAKHEEKQDNHGFVSREMTRIYKLPEDVDSKSVTSTMNSQGVLAIKATKQALEDPKETPIPVEFK